MDGGDVPPFRVGANPAGEPLIYATFLDESSLLVDEQTFLATSNIE